MAARPLFQSAMEVSAMSDLDSQTAYWDAAATTKTFTHPLHLPWLDDVDGHAVTRIQILARRGHLR
jgi:hypothetical protein